MTTVAALFVAKGGCYFGLDGIDPWDEARDARLYAGPHPVVAHPPCERHGRWAGGNAGEDQGCFESALNSVRRFGGVLEHPEASKAFAIHKLGNPPRGIGWVPSRDGIGFVCCVEQGHYGHRARKATWLYASGVELPELFWGKSVASIVPRTGRDPVRERRIGAVQRMCRKERKATPAAFRDLLLSIARSARR
jgi:hypothetical protein